MAAGIQEQRSKPLPPPKVSFGEKKFKGTGIPSAFQRFLVPAFCLNPLSLLQGLT